MALLEQIIDSTVYLARNGFKGDPKKRVSKMAEGDRQLSLFGEDEAARDVTCGVKGLPLGNLTSQFFANLYLNELDQYAKHTLKVRYYLRYMDDMLLFGIEKTALNEWERVFRQFAARELGLQMHPTGGPVPVTAGVGFLGFRLFPNRRKLKRTSVARFIRRMNDYTGRYSGHETSREEKAELLGAIRCSTRSFNAHAEYGNTYRIRRVLYDRFPIINQYGLAGMRPSHERAAITAHN